MAAYADFTYYTATYLGAAIAAADFPRLALRASEEIDRLTLDRAAAVVTAGVALDTIDRIRMATCAVAEELLAVEADGGADGIISESVGGHAVTYADSSSKRRTVPARLAEAARRYLATTGLMFRGFATGEYGGYAD